MDSKSKKRWDRNRSKHTSSDSRPCWLQASINHTDARSYLIYGSRLPDMTKERLICLKKCMGRIWILQIRWNPHRKAVKKPFNGAHLILNSFYKVYPKISPHRAWQKRSKIYLNASYDINRCLLQRVHEWKPLNPESKKRWKHIIAYLPTMASALKSIWGKACFTQVTIWLGGKIQ